MKQYDVVIIGGGIHGAGCAQAAAELGYKCLLLEQYSKPAQGTSSRSSKLIHGGLRYLESGQFSLVQECLAERRRLLKNAPDLVKLVPFYIPVYKQSKRRPWKIRMGLILYYLLGGGSFKSIPQNLWSELDDISTKDLIAVFQYWDAQTDDAALTQAVIESSKVLGADIMMNAQVKRAQRVTNSYRVSYLRDGESHEIETRCVINASGPWVNQLLEKVTPKPGLLSVDLVAGTHLVLPGQLNKGIYYLESPTDGRAIFVAPWAGNTLIGTTETLYKGKPEDISPTQDEIDYLLKVYSHYFSRRVTTTDIIDSFAGLRVLPAAGEVSESAFHRPRDTVILPDQKQNPRLFTIYGGKLTAYRATAEKVLNRIRPILESKI